MQRLPEGDGVEFVTKKKLQPGPVRIPGITPSYPALIYMRVFRNGLTSDAPLRDADAVAAGFFDQEVETMRREGKGQYSLDKVKRGTEVIDGRSLHVMTFRTGTWTWSQPSALYLWFPADFAQSREFYGFLIAARVPLEGTTAPTLEEVRPVIVSFRLDEATSVAPAASPGTAPNPDAMGRLESSAEQGDVAAQRELAHRHLTGDGVVKDLAQAEKWFRLAAARGDADAQYNLAVMYKDGEGVPADAAEAARWCRLAAEQDYAMAQHAMGVIYDQGDGVARDPVTAAAWYRKAAEQGYAPAQYNLAAMYAEGRGVSRDLVQSYRWLEIIAMHGDTALQREARDVQSRLATAMSASQLEEAKRLAAAWPSRTP
jgi:hypothetical protein